MSILLDANLRASEERYGKLNVQRATALWSASRIIAGYLAGAPTTPTMQRRTTCRNVQERVSAVTYALSLQFCVHGADIELIEVAIGAQRHNGGDGLIAWSVQQWREHIVNERRIAGR